MSYAGQPIQGINGLGGTSNVNGLEMLAMMEIMLGMAMLLTSENRQAGAPGAGGIPGYGGGIPGIGGATPGYGGGIPGYGGGIPGIGGLPVGIDQSGLSPLGQNLVPFRNGVPVVTAQNKQQAIVDYLQNHASFSSPQDAQYLVDSLNRLPTGELNLLFQNGTTYQFTANDPTFRQNGNVLGYETDLNANNQRTNPNIVINEADLHDPSLGPSNIEQTILHETTHAVDGSLAAALGLPTELASQSDPAVQQAFQNYRFLNANGLVNWDNTATDPHGRYPAQSNGSELVADAGKIIDSGGAGTIAQQDPATLNAVASLLAEANAVGNQIVGL